MIDPLFTISFIILLFLALAFNRSLPNSLGSKVIYYGLAGLTAVLFLIYMLGITFPPYLPIGG